jgi:hypothetical protein
MYFCILTSDIKDLSKDSNKEVINGKQRATGKAHEINKSLTPQKKTTLKDPPSPIKLDAKSGGANVEEKEKQQIDSPSNKYSADKALNSDPNKTQIHSDGDTDNKNIEKKIQNPLDEFLKNKNFN